MERQLGVRKCSHCHESGHDRRRCPSRVFIEPAVDIEAPVEVGLPASLPSIQFFLSAMPQPSHAQRLIALMHLTQTVQHTTISRQSIPAQGTQSRIDVTTPAVLHTTILRPSVPVQALPPRYQLDLALLPLDNTSK